MASLSGRCMVKALHHYNNIADELNWSNKLSTAFCCSDFNSSHKLCQMKTYKPTDLLRPWGGEGGWRAVKTSGAQLMGFTQLRSIRGKSTYIIGSVDHH